MDGGGDACAALLSLREGERGEQREKGRVPEVKKRDGHIHHCSTLPYRVGYSIGFHIGRMISRK